MKQFIYTLFLSSIFACGLSFAAAIKEEATNEAALNAYNHLINNEIRLVFAELAKISPEILPTININPGDGKPIRSLLYWIVSACDNNEVGIMGYLKELKIDLDEIRKQIDQDRNNTFSSKVSEPKMNFLADAQRLAKENAAETAADAAFYRSEQIRWGYTYLHVATVQRDIPQMTKLLSTRANINATDRQNDTPLHLAAMRCNFAVVKFLLENGANTCDFFKGFALYSNTIIDGRIKHV